jgi:hypothetical protein
LNWTAAAAAAAAAAGRQAGRQAEKNGHATLDGLVWLDGLQLDSYPDLAIDAILLLC